MLEFSQQQRDYLFKAIEDKTRMAILHRSFKARFRNFVDRALDDYGLAEKFQAAKATGEKVRILDFGCGEGLYLHDMAEVLETRGLLENAELTGIDLNPASIATAEDFARLAKPPRPYLNFVLQDGRLPFSENPALKSNGESRFDFIYSLVTFMYIPEARTYLQKLYQEDLKPGGTIFLRDLVVDVEHDDFLIVHPAIRPAVTFYTAFVRSLNQGLSVANLEAGWLREFGAEPVEQIYDQVPASSKNPEEMGMMRQIIMIVQNIGPQMVNKGLITEREFEAMIEQVYQELNQSSHAQVTYMITLARKPPA